MHATIAEKILNKPPGRKILLKPDLCMINDGPGHICLDLLEPARGVALLEKTVVILDHSIPAGSFDSAAVQKKLIRFARANAVKFIQSAGIGYHILLDDFVGAGDIVVSCGSHNGIFGAGGALGLHLEAGDMAALLMAGSLEMTVPRTAGVRLTDKLREGVSVIDFILHLLAQAGPEGFAGRVLEFRGPGLGTLSASDRIAMCAMGTQTGALSALIDENDDGKDFVELEIDLSRIAPSVALPGSLHACKPVTDLQGTPVHAGFVGGCMGGRIENIRTVADILKAIRVKPGVRLMIGPATNRVYLQAMGEGLIDLLLDRGAQVTNPGCASCRTDAIGVVGDGENLVSTGCYNSAGCCGTARSNVYIASAATVARTAATGYIA